MNDKLESMLQNECSEPYNLPLEYLRNITNNFSDERLLGEGGFGTVYKIIRHQDFCCGEDPSMNFALIFCLLSPDEFMHVLIKELKQGVLKNGETIAVKKLNSSIAPGVKDKLFENEADHLMRLKHPNVVLLVGWCSETEYIPMEYNGKYIHAEKPERLLCLEYMPKGNLRGYLSDASSGLDWGTRYNIIEGICYGLNYLHVQWQPHAPIVHMDLKPANILLDNNMVPKISDFGLSRLFSEEKTWTCTINLNGTLGYMSPEYINRGLISTKSDIFSLGVIIIEIVTGHREYPDETETSSEEFIEMVVKNWRRRNGMKMLFGPGALKFYLDMYQQIRRCIRIGLDCVKIDRLKRPTISQIIRTLHGLGNHIEGVHRPQVHRLQAKMPWEGSQMNLVPSSLLKELLFSATIERPLSQELQSKKRERNYGKQAGWNGQQRNTPLVSIELRPSLPCTSGRRRLLYGGLGLSFTED